MTTLNYKIYNQFYNLGTSVRRRIPNVLLPKRGLGQRVEIGVSTYIDRYDKYFLPLYKDLLRIFPDVGIRIAVNGFYDQVEQHEYLRRVESELCQTMPSNVTFILHDKPAGLTRLWNSIVNQNTHEFTLLLNDDLSIYPWLRVWLEKICDKSKCVTLMNNSWSNFLISRQAIDHVGWFDEGYEGIGFEDMDYTARCLMKGLKIDNFKCAYINHREHMPSRTSYDQKSGTVWSKYSGINREYFSRKWQETDETTGIYIRQLNSNVKKTAYEPMISQPKKILFTDGVYYPDRE